MAATREKLFNSIATGAAWDAGVVFNRTNSIPLDKFSVFASYELAVEYATNGVSYPGQLLAVVRADEKVTGYIILTDGRLLPLATSDDLETLSERISGLEDTVKILVSNISNKGSVVTFTKHDGQSSSFNTTFVGTRAEYELEHAAGNIPTGTVVIITDEPDDEELADASAASAILGVGKLGHLILG